MQDESNPGERYVPPEPRTDVATAARGDASVSGVTVWESGGGLDDVEGRES
jgi:hypothetical protein